MPEVAIVGAGPAGVAAAGVLVDAGVQPVVLDEARAPGGQIYRCPDADTGLDLTAVLGRDAAAHEAFHARAAAILARCDYRPRTLVWGMEERTLFMEADGRVAEVAVDALILATGATDRVMPLPGWTLPGVFSLGGAQVLLKGQGCLIGQRVVFAGASPLLYLAAKQYLAAGATVVAVVDTTRFSAKMAATPALAASSLVTLWRGLSYVAEVQRHGVPILTGRRVVRFEGRDGLEAIVHAGADGREARLPCDAVGYGFGLKPEAQLAELAGARFVYDPDFRQWFPDIDADGRGGQGLYLAGDGCRIGGAEAAAASGQLAAAACLADLGLKHGVDQDRERRRVARLRRFQRALTHAFRWPAEWLQDLGDDVIVCRCEGVMAGQLRQVIARPLGPVDVNRVKALTRAGMGRCQGRFCGLAAAEISAAAAGCDHAAAGRLRGQAPVKPLPMALHPYPTAAPEAVS
jgi:NADPH-dependent 2,4-dienoyl-CoA reductase/sulfur reductase-like enzyme